LLKRFSRSEVKVMTRQNALMSEANVVTLWHRGSAVIGIIIIFYAEGIYRKGKCRDFTCSSKADKISLVYHTNQTKKMKRAKQKKN